MEELFNHLISRHEFFEKLDFKTLSVSKPNGTRFGVSYYHEKLNLYFSVVWDRMEMLITSANFGEKKVYKWFGELLEFYSIPFCENRLYYPLTKGRQFDKEIFEETLDYNLKKLEELILKVE